MFVGKEKKRNAYMTVEAAFLMPMAVAGVVFTIYLGFYLYNLCVIHQVAYTAALRGSLERNLSQSEVQQYTEQELEKLIDGRLMAISHIEKEVKVGISKVEVYISAEIEMPFAAFISDKIGIWRIQKTAEAGRIDPVFVIRNIRKIER